MASRILRTTVLAVFGLIWIIPVYLLIANAAKSAASYSGSELWSAGNFADFGKNVVAMFSTTDVPASLGVTVLYSVVSPLIAVILGSAVAFGIIVLKLKHGFAWFFFLFCGTVFPLQMMVIPLFDGYAHAGLFDTRVGMVIIYSAVTLPFSAFVMRNFFSGIAGSVFEAAVVDGAGPWRIFTRIYVPLSTSALAVVFMLQATWVWNDLLLGLVLTQSPAARPVMPVLTGLRTAAGSGVSYTLVLTIALLVSLPTVVMFLVFQRFFSRGLSLGQY